MGLFQIGDGELQIPLGRRQGTVAQQVLRMQRFRMT